MSSLKTELKKIEAKLEKFNFSSPKVARSELETFENMLKELKKLKSDLEQVVNKYSMPLNRVDSEAYDLAQKVKVNFVGTTLKGLTDAIFACQDLVLKYKSFEKPKA